MAVLLLTLKVSLIVFIGGLLTFRTKQFAITHLFYIYPNAGLVLFCITGWMFSIMFETIGHDIDNFRRRLHVQRLLQTDVSIRKWRRQFVNVCRLVRRLNETFGIILLISITQLFIGAITSANFIFESTKMTSPMAFFDALLLSKSVIDLWLLSYIPHKIKNEVVTNLSWNQLVFIFTSCPFDLYCRLWRWGVHWVNWACRDQRDWIKYLIESNLGQLEQFNLPLFFLLFL